MNIYKTKSAVACLKNSTVAALTVAMLLSSASTIALAAQSAAEGPPRSRAEAPPAPLADFSLTTTGDSIISIRTTSELDNPKFIGVVKAVKEGDAAFTNFEENTPKPGTWPGATSGNTYMNTTPDSFQDLIDMGINLFGLANNHSFDFGTQGLVDTLEAAAKFKSVAAFAGAGHTLGEARAPAYLNTRHGRIALIDGVSTFIEAAVAGDPRPDMPGRPGINPVRYMTLYNLDQATFDVLKSIQNRPGIAGNFDQGGGVGGVPGIWGAEGFGGRREPNSVTANGRVYHLSDKPGVVRKLMQHDMEAIVHNVKDAKARAAYVLTSVHNHENGVEPFPNPDPALGNPASTADFMIEFAHAVIDAGADEFSGHGPHNLRGIEIYKGKPILYSLSDFFLQNDLNRIQPTEFYNRYQLGPDALPSDAFAARGNGANVEQAESAVARTLFKNGKPVEVKLTPIFMRLQVKGNEGRYGVPELADAARSARILGRLQEMSKPFGTTITIRDGVGYIAIPQ